MKKRKSEPRFCQDKKDFQDKNPVNPENLKKIVVQDKKNVSLQIVKI